VQGGLAGGGSPLGGTMDGSGAGSAENLDQRLDELAELVRTGDHEAFREMVLAVEPRLRAFLASYAPNAELVEEVLQASLITCYQRIASYQPRRTFLPWLKALARNELRDELRRQRRWCAMEDQVLESLVVDHALHDLEADDGTDVERLRRLEHCLGLLSDRMRKLIERRYREQTPIKQLAVQFKQSQSALTMLLFRTRNKLRSCLEAKH